MPTVAATDPGGLLNCEVANQIATVRLNRPEVRNALSSALLDALEGTMASLDCDCRVSVIIVTGTDPAFCAGLDLSDRRLFADPGALPARPWTPTSKPVIGAINGVAVTGGLELALACDFLIASDRARFGDTHARLGIMPSWGMSVLLPARVGLARAVEMSLTGNFLTAAEALSVGLVNRVIDHEGLLPLARHVAGDIASNDQVAVRALLASVRRIELAGGIADGLHLEAEAHHAWQEHIDPAEVERRRAKVVTRGRNQ